jgi:NAD(P)H-flavin reductase
MKSIIWKKIPYKVSINEAVELAKTYSTEEAYKFINGILAQVVKDLKTKGEIFLYKVLEKKVLAEGLYEMKISAPDFAKKAKAGHFLIIKVAEKGERIPLTVADFDPEEGTVTIVFAAIGVSTEKIAELEVGDEVNGLYWTFR